MSPSPSEQVAVLCNELALKVIEYERLVTDRANAETTYKASFARRVMRARLEEGVKDISEAEHVATGDPAIEDLRRVYLVAEGVADACQKQIASHRARIDYGRSRIATERAQDMLHAQGVGGHS